MRASGFAAVSLDSLNYGGNALPDADAHGAKRSFQPPPFQLYCCRHNQARTAHTEWMTQRDGASIGIYMLSIVRETETSEDSDSLGSERFIQFDNIDRANFYAQPGEQLLSRWHWANAHYARRNTGRTDAHNPRP